jgi:DNA-directed RNA polymerase subunit beta
MEYVKIHNGGDTQFKPNEHVPLEAVEEANANLKDGQRAADFEPFPFYLTAWDEDKYVIGQANIELDEKEILSTSATQRVRKANLLRLTAKKFNIWMFRRNSLFR